LTRRPFHRRIEQQHHLYVRERLHHCLAVHPPASAAFTEDTLPGSGS
jgi:hypothetical protein